MAIKKARGQINGHGLFEIVIKMQALLDAGFFYFCNYSVWGEAELLS